MALQSRVKHSTTEPLRSQMLDCICHMIWKLLRNHMLRFCHLKCNIVFCFLRPKSTAMVMAGRSVHLTTLFPGQA